MNDADKPDLYSHPDDRPREMIYNKPPITDPAELAISHQLAADMEAHPGRQLRDWPAVAPQPLRFLYRNWRGEIAERHATPLSIRFGTSTWHKEPGWLMRALDHDKGEEREFALKDCDFFFYASCAAADPGVWGPELRVEGPL